MKAEEVRSKTDSELRFDMNGLKEELFKLRLRSSAETLPNPSRIREVRRSIARIKTILDERANGVRGAQPRS